jgi:3-hydroxybutyryl-CoA dehydrogenase
MTSACIIGHVTASGYICSPTSNMTVAILANAEQKEEWLSKAYSQEVKLVWASNPTELLDQKADAYFNLLFQTGRYNIHEYAQLKVPLFINEVIHPFAALAGFDMKLPFPLVRLNAWPGFLKRQVVEVATANKEDAIVAEHVFLKLGLKSKWVPDIPGLITARIIAMLINEAYFTLEQEVSTKKEIDIAMKLGTNYPYGPFEWSDIIGLDKIFSLLTEMSKTDKKYQPSDLLRKEAEQQTTWH